MSEAQPYQVMPEMDEQAFKRLKEDIKQHGVEYPIIIDADGEVIDGHHRKRAWQELGRDVDDLPTRIIDASDTENYHRAYRTNLLQRDLTDGTKRQVVKQYLLEHPERVDDDTQEAIASDLGVAQDTVSRAKKELEQDGKLNELGKLSTDDKKQRVREYVDDNPDASNREVADAVDFDVSHASVGNWRNEWGEDTDDATGLDTFTTSKEEKETTQELVEEAKSGNDTAQEQVEKMSSGKTTATNAQKTVQKKQRQEERSKEEERLKESDDELPSSFDVQVGDALEKLAAIEDGSVDTLITDPPYGVKEEYDWDTFEDFLAFFDEWFGLAIDKLADEHSGFVFTDARRMHEVAEVIERHTEIKNTIVWVRKNMSMGRTINEKFISAYEPVFYFGTRELNLPDEWGEERFDVFEYAVPQSNFEEGKYHPTQKPVELCEDFVRLGSYEGDTILDPFAGVFTTAVAVENVGSRDCILVEQEQEYVDIGEGRINEL